MIEKTTTKEHQEMINKTVDAVMHEANRNAVGLALLCVANSLAVNAAPDADFETQLCLTFQLIKDALEDVANEPEMVSANHYFEQVKILGLVQ